MAIINQSLLLSFIYINNKQLVKKEENMKNLSKEELFSYTILILTCITIIYTGILIGTPLYNNVLIINIILNALAIITVIFNIKNKKIKINNIDIIIFFLVLSSTVPLIFRTYSSLNDTVIYILKYISVFNIYIITKNLCKNNSKAKVTLIATIIFVSVILVLFGIDKMSIRVFDTFYDYLHLEQPSEQAIRMDSLFGYSNAFAINMLAAYILTLSLYLKNGRLSKLLIAVLTFQMFGIIMSGSRLTYITGIISIIVLAVLQKNKQENIRMVEAVLISTIISVITSAIYYKLFNLKEYIYIWISIIISLIMSVIISIMLSKANKKIYELNTKKFFKLMFTVAVLIITFFIIALNWGEKLVLFTGINSEDSTRKQVFNIKPNTEYNFSFDIDAKAGERDDTYVIIIKELDKNEKEITTNRIRFNEYKGIKEIKVITTPETRSINIKISCNQLTENTGLTIYNLKINGKEEKINYKLLPVAMVDRVEQTFKGNSMYERITYLKDGFKIIKKNWILGKGGNAWLYNYAKVKDYNYTTIECHSYPNQLWMQFGLLGIISYLLLITAIIRNYLKKDNYVFNGVICAILAVVLHSLLDFEMSFLYTLIVFYMLIAIFNSDENYVEDNTNKKLKKINVAIQWLLIILLTGTLLVNIGGLVAEKIDKISTKVKTENQKQVMIDLKLKFAPYNYKYKMDKYNYILELEKTNKTETLEEQKEIILNSIAESENINKSYYLYSRLTQIYIDNINEQNVNEILKNIKKIYNRCYEETQGEYVVTVSQRIINQLDKQKVKNKDIDEFKKTLQQNIKNIREKYYE